MQCAFHGFHSHEPCLKYARLVSYYSFHLSRERKPLGNVLDRPLVLYSYGNAVDLCAVEHRSDFPVLPHQASGCAA